MKIWLSSLLFCALFFTSCDTATAPVAAEKQSTAQVHQEKPTADTRALIEEAHNKSVFLKSEVVAFDIVLNFGGKERLRGKQILATDGSKGMLIKENGDTIIYNGSKVACSPSVSTPENARFAAYTWSYFFLFPYKLNDAGTIWKKQANSFLKPKEYAAHKLTFESGIGDDPNDWYIAYSDRKTNLVQLAAYIVTSGGTVEEAEEDPHAIEYLNYADIDGIPLASNWVFHEWREGKGLTRELGNASLSNFQFDAEVHFDIPAHFIESK